MNQNDFDRQMSVLDRFIHEHEAEMLDGLLKDTESTLTDTPLKSKTEAVENLKKDIKIKLDKTREDVSKGLHLFVDKTSGTEREKFVQLMTKVHSFNMAIAEKKELPKEILSVEDLEFLLSIANREFASNHNAEASSMFRTIIHLNPFYSAAWVGWALAEYEQDHLDIVDQIYELGLTFLDNDPMISLYAAQFYIQTNSQPRAKVILRNAQKACLDRGMEESSLVTEINKLLNMV